MLRPLDEHVNTTVNRHIVCRTSSYLSLNLRLKFLFASQISASISRSII